jgi:pimeloyl-ACP methyl ester carboxylesterase
MAMATFVLVPGVWLGGWAWREVTPHLAAAGHESHPVTLTGLADRAHLATPEVDLATHVDDIVGLIEHNDLHDVVLVGHSGAGTPVTGAADRVPERLSRVVYVDSGPLPEGMAQVDFNGPQAREELEKLVASEGAGWRIPVPAFDPAEDPVNLAGLSEEHLALMRELGTPHPFRAAAEPLRRPPAPPVVPKSLIASTFTVAQVEELIASGNPVFALMAGAEWSRHELLTGHWPMFSRPADLAALLGRISAL